MPSRLLFIKPRGTMRAGTERSTSLPTARRSSVSRAALVPGDGFDVDVVGEQLDWQPDGFGGLIRQHHRGRAGIDDHRRGDTIDRCLQGELAAIAARDIDGTQHWRDLLAQDFRDERAGLRNLLGIAIGKRCTCGGEDGDDQQQDARHAASPQIKPFRTSLGVTCGRKSRAARGRPPSCAFPASP